MVAGSSLLGVTAASPHLFLSSSATDALERAIEESTRYGAGLTIALHDARRDRLAGGDERVPTASTRDRVLRRAAAGVPHLDERILSILSDAVLVSSRRVEAAGANPVRLVHRTDALRHVRQVEGVGGTGVWVQDVTADSLRVGPGDDIFLEKPTGERIRVPVGGVYEALANAPPDPYWEPLADHFRPPSIDAPLPPPFVLVDRGEIEPLLDRLGQGDADFQWEFPLAARAELDLGRASDLMEEFTDFVASLQNTRSPVGRYFRCTTCQVPTPIRLNLLSTLENDVQRARDTSDSLRPSIELLAVAGLLTALVVLGAAGLYSVGRRRTEMQLLVARGVAPATLGLKAALESALPLVAGAGCGLVASLLVLERYGPGERLDTAAFGDALRSVATTTPFALLVIGTVAGLATVRFTPRGSGSRHGTRLLWEIPVLLGAGLALRQIVTGDGLVAEAGSAVERVSPWLLAFPVLFVSGGGGLAARAFRRVLIAVRTARLRVRPALYLALNRLATARSLAIMLITASGLALGIFLYAQTMAASVRATTNAKARVFTGSDVAVPVDRQYVAPPSFEWPHTTVSSKLDAGRLEPSNQTVDFLAVDVATFEHAAYWDDAFSRRPLGELMRDLEGRAGDSLKVIVAGAFPEGVALEVGGVPVTYEVVERVDAFPGQYLDRLLLVVDSETVGDVIEAAGALNPITAAGATTSLWVKGDAGRVLASLADLGFGPDDVLTAQAVLENPSFVAVARTFGFLESLGALAALLVLVGLVLYVQARQRGRSVSYALARRMGLRAGSHYAALVVELVLMLALALAVGGALGAAAARLVYARVDLLPNIPPQPLLRIPFDAVLPALAGIALAVTGGALLAHRSAERADVAEALRSGA